MIDLTLSLVAVLCFASGLLVGLLATRKPKP